MNRNPNSFTLPPEGRLVREEESERLHERAEHLNRIGADAEYRICGWCGHLMPLATQAGRPLYRYRPGKREYVHPACLEFVVWAESN